MESSAKPSGVQTGFSCTEPTKLWLGLKVKIKANFKSYTAWDSACFLTCTLSCAWTGSSPSPSVG